MREINSTILGHEDNWKKAHKRRLMHRVQTKLVLFYYVLLLMYCASRGRERVEEAEAAFPTKSYYISKLCGAEHDFLDFI